MATNMIKMHMHIGLNAICCNPTSKKLDIYGHLKKSFFLSHVGDKIPL